jgi:hypothetical protein
MTRYTPYLMFAAFLAVAALLTVALVSCGSNTDEPSTRVSDVRLFDISSPKGIPCVVAESALQDAIAMSCEWER